MASSLALPLLLLLLLATTDAAAAGCYTSLFSFGDSLTDTGNQLATNRSSVGAASQLPFGETYFGRPTGRFCDGRIIVDFIAQAIGVPLVPPYYARGSADDFRQGANFAVGGATALNNTFFRDLGLDANWTDISLGVQIQSFKKLLQSSPSIADPSILSNSLFLVGEIGGNDYNHQFLRNITMDKIRTSAPNVIRAIGSAITTLIQLGAKTLVVPGNLPIGCVAIYLKQYQSDRAEDYEPKSGCLKRMNEFSVHHNRLLQDELDFLRGRYPNVSISYADYYTAAMRMYESPKQFGFNGVLKGCCMGCENSLCSDPSSYISWDGMHLTEAAYKTIADGLLRGPVSVPSLNKTCPYMQSSSASRNTLPFYLNMDLSTWFGS